MPVYILAFLVAVLGNLPYCRNATCNTALVCIPAFLERIPRKSAALQECNQECSTSLHSCIPGLHS
jgi:hypothetical protein